MYKQALIQTCARGRTTRGDQKGNKAGMAKVSDSRGSSYKEIKLVVATKSG